MAYLLTVIDFICYNGMDESDGESEEEGPKLGLYIRSDSRSNWDQGHICVFSG